MDDEQTGMQPLMTYKQVAERYGLKIGTLYALVSQKRIPHVRLGNRFCLFDSQAISVWLQGKAVPPKEGGQ